MNKPITMSIKETKTKIVNACNESGLSPVILDLIVQGIYTEIRTLAEKQTAEDEMAYARMLEEEKKAEMENAFVENDEVETIDDVEIVGE